jgi:hypothetical protein
VAFAGYLAWKRVGVRIDWGLQAMEFDTFSGRWCSGVDLQQKPDTGQKYRLGCAAATGASWSFGSVSSSSSLSFLCLCDFLSSNNLRIEFPNSLCMLFDLIPFCWHSAVGGSEALEGYRFSWSIIQHSSILGFSSSCDVLW